MNENRLHIGMKQTERQQVTSAMSASQYGSGMVEVFSTPAMVAFMEKTCQKLVQAHLENGFGTVGIHLDIHHVKATPINKTVSCEAELIEIDGKKLRFKVVAKDEEGEIGHGFHSRFIINLEKFMSKLGK